MRNNATSSMRSDRRCDQNERSADGPVQWGRLAALLLTRAGRPPPCGPSSPRPPQAQAAAADKGHARDLRLRPGRRHRRLHAEQPGLVRRQPAVAAAECREPVRPDGHFYISPRQSRLGVRARSRPSGRPAERRSSSSTCSASAATPGRRPSVCATRGAVEADRRRPDQQPVHGRRTSSPTSSTTGDRTACCSSGTCRCSGSRSMTASSNARIAIENPGASGDAGVLADRVELQNVKPRFPSPDFTGHYRPGGRNWGHVQVERRPPPHRLRRHSCPTTDFDLSGQRLGLGHQRSART